MKKNKSDVKKIKALAGRVDVVLSFGMECMKEIKAGDRYNDKSKRTFEGAVRA